ncbi:carboxymuconolactone decarboxylase family protein [Variovorax sp. Root473]|jgi:alkylhydroperoxidase family enzyme|uniref:carboxymuconolactone decarboxylase family protein n=1 Tax=Variovorax sp. Root473 TaxID=1736541 RepID=UPI0009E9A5D0|nr:carboxymuconolactone decarboxylase family protein [Variovorax sp. Root473]
MTGSAVPFLAPSRRLPLRPPPYEPEVAAAIQSTAFKGLSPLNLRLALANHSTLGPAFQAMAHVVLFQCALPERDREIAIIRTGALTRSEYEWGMHVSIYAEKCGLDAVQVRELTESADWQALSPTRWTDKERLIVRMVDELHRHSTVSDQTWQSLCAGWPQAQVIELIFASSFYHMAAFFLNSAGVPLEPGAQRFCAPVAQAKVPA